jgi:hypothetical protein
MSSPNKIHAQINFEAVDPLSPFHVRWAQLGAGCCEDHERNARATVKPDHRAGPVPHKGRMISRFANRKWSPLAYRCPRGAAS